MRTPNWLSRVGNCFSAGGFPSNPIPVRVCAEHYASLLSNVIVKIKFLLQGEVKPGEDEVRGLYLAAKFGYDVTEAR